MFDINYIKTWPFTIDLLKVEFPIKILDKYKSCNELYYIKHNKLFLYIYLQETHQNICTTDPIIEKNNLARIILKKKNNTFKYVSQKKKIYTLSIVNLFRTLYLNINKYSYFINIVIELLLNIAIS